MTTNQVKCLPDVLSQIDRLMAGEESEGYHVSLYQEAGNLPGDAERARIQFKNLESSAVKALRDGGAAPEVIRAFLEESGALSRRSEFWQGQRGGLAFFWHDSGRTEVLKTGIPFTERAVVSSRFHLKPLLAAAANADAYWLLSVSLNEVKLWRGSRLGFRAIEVPGLPSNYANAVEEAGYPGESRKVAVAEMRMSPTKECLRVYFQIIDDVLRSRLNDSELPLLLASVDYYAPVFAAVCTYPHLSTAHLAGNPERWSASDLQDRARALLREDFKKSVKRQLLRCKGLVEKGRALTSLNAILRAAGAGRIKTLFVPADACFWGAYDDDEERAERVSSPGSDAVDLYEEAALRALDNGGEVFFLAEKDLPGDHGMIALPRW